MARKTMQFFQWLDINHGLTAIRLRQDYFLSLMANLKKAQVRQLIVTTEHIFGQK
jgi:hypothetical protein